MEMKRPPPEDELETRLIDLLRSVEQPAPSPGFATRTMKAVRLEPLPAGRQALRHPWGAPLGWTALVGAAAALAYAAIFNQPGTAKAFTTMLTFALHGSGHLTHFVGAGVALSDMFTTVGYAVARAAATREGTTTLMLIAGVAGTSLLALQRLLFSDGEVSQWEELS